MYAGCAYGNFWGTLLVRDRVPEASQRLHYPAPTGNILLYPAKLVGTEEVWFYRIESPGLSLPPGGALAIAHLVSLPLPSYMDKRAGGVFPGGTVGLCWVQYSLPSPR